MKTIAFLLSMIVSGHIFALSDRDSNAGIMYIQSITVPELLEQCLIIYPELEDPISILIYRWKEENSKLIKRGKKIFEKQCAKDGVDPDKAYRLEIDQIVKEFLLLSPQEQKEQCANFLEVLISEI